MNIIKMTLFGATLTDREDGKKAFISIIKQNKPIITLDFSGVISLGSSFGDEIIPGIAAIQKNKIEILNANIVIQNSIKRTLEDMPIRVTFKNSH